MRTRQNAIGRSNLYGAGLMAVGALGVLCLTVGAWKVFFADGGPGLTVLLVIGAALTLCPFVVPRLTAIALSRRVPARAGHPPVHGHCDQSRLW